MQGQPRLFDKAVSIATHSTDEYHGLEAFAQYSDEREDEERPLFATGLALVLARERRGVDFVVESTSELDLPLEL